MADRIVIKNIEVMASHGLSDEERRSPRPFLVDLMVEEDTSLAAVTDDLVNTFWYADLVEDVVAEMTGTPVRFRETIAVRIAERILDRGPALGVEVTIHTSEFPASVPVEEAMITVRRVNPLFDDNLGIRRAVLRLASDAADGAEVISEALEDLRELNVFVSNVSEPVQAPNPLLGSDCVHTTVVAIIHTAMSPAALRKELQHVEVRNGRIAGSRMAGRRIEISIMTFGSLESRHPRLTLPHPTAVMDRSFLQAWHSIDSDARLNGSPVAAMLDSLGPSAG